MTRSPLPVVTIPVSWRTYESLNVIYLHDIPLLNVAKAIWEKEMRLGVSTFEDRASNYDSDKLPASKFPLFESPNNICILEQKTHYSHLLLFPPSSSWW